MDAKSDEQPIVIDGQSVTSWPSPEFTLILDAFEAACKQTRPKTIWRQAPPLASLPARKLKKPWERAIGVEPSLGSVSDSYDNALVEAINGLYKAEVIH